MICTLPFDGFFVNAMGKFSPCCALSVMDEDYDSNDSDGAITIEQDGDFINHQSMIDLRKQHHRGEITNRNCIKCIRRYKTHFVTTDINEGEIEVSYDEETGRIEQPEFSYLNIAFSNRCNLACRMCSSINSNKFGSLMNGKVRLQDVIYLSDEWYNEQDPGAIETAFDDAQFEYLIDHTQAPKNISIHGGEPFMEPRVLEFLNAAPTPEHLHITTNGTKRPRLSLIEILNRGNTSITFSIEGTKDVQEYVRIGSDMNVIIDNMRHIREQCPHVDFHTNTVVTAYNWGSIGEFMRLAPLFSDIGVTHMNLDWNATYDHIDFFKVLTEDEFNAGKRDMMKLLIEVNSMKINEELRASIRKSVMNFMHKELEYDETLRAKFDEYNKRVDKHR